MAKAKMTFKTPLLPLSWVSVRGHGKLKKDQEDNQLPENYNYTATVTLTKEQADVIIKKFAEFWKDNKPKGVGKQKYDLVKEEFIKVLGDDGKPLLDAEDEPIKEATGMYTLQAKTVTQWPKDAKPNIIKLMGSNGEILQEGHKLEDGCGEGTMGIIHGSIGVNDYNDNEGLQFYLNGVQIKDSSFAEYTGGGNEINADAIDDEDVAETEIPESEKPNV